MWNKVFRFENEYVIDVIITDDLKTFHGKIKIIGQHPPAVEPSNKKQWIGRYDGMFLVEALFIFPNWNVPE